eukprot:g455.t1
MQKVTGEWKKKKEEVKDGTDENADGETTKKEATETEGRRPMTARERRQLKQRLIRKRRQKLKENTGDSNAHVDASVVAELFKSPVEIQSTLKRETVDHAEVVRKSLPSPLLSGLGKASIAHNVHSIVCRVCISIGGGYVAYARRRDEELSSEFSLIVPVIIAILIRMTNWKGVLSMIGFGRHIEASDRSTAGIISFLTRAYRIVGDIKTDVAIFVFAYVAMHCVLDAGSDYVGENGVLFACFVGTALCALVLAISFASPSSKRAEERIVAVVESQLQHRALMFRCGALDDSPVEEVIIRAHILDHVRSENSALGDEDMWCRVVARLTTNGGRIVRHESKANDETSKKACGPSLSWKFEDDYFRDGPLSVMSRRGKGDDDGLTHRERRLLRQRMSQRRKAGA